MMLAPLSLVLLTVSVPSKPSSSADVASATRPAPTMEERRLAESSPRGSPARRGAYLAKRRADDRDREVGARLRSHLQFRETHR